MADGTDYAELNSVIGIAGYAYDPKQDIFFSTLNPWQRSVGYCRLYDEAAAPLGMIVDCEPVYFDYKNKRWMISFWKGQYDLVTGGEIGIYTDAVDISLPGVFSGTFYHCASDAEHLEMSFTLKKHGKTLFNREGRHWWLTGFKLGEFSEPEELSMDVELKFEDLLMLNAFVSALKGIGYSDEEVNVKSNYVSFTFAAPRSPQPKTRTKETDWIIQRKNQKLCELYQAIAEPFDNLKDKLDAVEKQAPELSQKILKHGKSKTNYEVFILLILIGTIIISSLSIMDD